jgi:hypothetical protein
MEASFLLSRNGVWHPRPGCGTNLWRPTSPSSPSQTRCPSLQHLLAQKRWSLLIKLCKLISWSTVPRQKLCKLISWSTVPRQTIFKGVCQTYWGYNTTIDWNIGGKLTGSRENMKSFVSWSHGVLSRGRQFSKVCVRRIGLQHHHRLKYRWKTNWFSWKHENWWEPVLSVYRKSVN